MLAAAILVSVHAATHLEYDPVVNEKSAFGVDVHI
jgi:hypothetical protein